MAGIAGLEPTKCQNQNLVPYQLGYIPKKEVGKKEHLPPKSNIMLSCYVTSVNHF